MSHHYNRTAVETLAILTGQVSSSNKDALSSSSLDDERAKLLKQLITAIAVANGQASATGEELDALVGVWHFLLERVPTFHLSPLFKHVRDAKRDSYQMQPKDLIAAWNDRYDEEPGMPPPGYSWFRDEWGKFLPARADEHGIFPYGGTDWQEAARQERILADKWQREHLDQLSDGSIVRLINRSLQA